MSDDQRMFDGYGRGWSEKKARGLARFFQIMREPATGDTYYVALAIISLGILAALLHL